MVSEIKKSGYGTVYQAVTRNPDIPAAAKGLYAYLSAFCGASDECFPSVEMIVKEMGISRETFYRHINALVAAGIVEKWQMAGSGGKFGHTVYRLTHKTNEMDFRCTENPTTENPTTENPTTINNTFNNKHIKKNNIDYQQIADLYNLICTSFPKLTKLSDRRKQAIRARFNQGYTLDDFKKLFELAENSSFLKGSNNRNWQATFDWLIADTNMAKVLDGNYINREMKNNDKTTAKIGRTARDFYEQILGTGDRY